MSPSGTSLPARPAADIQRSQTRLGKPRSLVMAEADRRGGPVPGANTLDATSLQPRVRPREAVILAGGLGTRAAASPGSILEADRDGGRPPVPLDYLLNQLRSWAIRDVVISVGLAPIIPGASGEGNTWEASPCATSWKLRRSGQVECAWPGSANTGARTFLTLNGDSLVDIGSRLWWRRIGPKGATTSRSGARSRPPGLGW